MSQSLKLSISNLAWSAEHDAAVYELMRKMGFTGLEIAPTRVFPEQPYEQLNAASDWKEQLSALFGFAIPSMQSIWYGRTERLFGSEAERQALTAYTKQAVDFAEVIGCGNLVFGCPRNRFRPEGADESAAVAFFRETGDYAASHHTVIAMEANPPLYNTNYINTTASAIGLIEKVGSAGFRLNLDLGTMIWNRETLAVLRGKEHLIHHVHISEPGLKPIEKRDLHTDLHRFLSENGYEGFVSIEMGKTDDLTVLAGIMDHICKIFRA